MTRRQFNLSTPPAAPPMPQPAAMPPSPVVALRPEAVAPLHEFPKPVSADSLTPAMRDELLAIGWDGHSDIPGDLGATVTRLRQAYDAERAAAEADMSQRKPAKIPRTVHLHELPVASQEEIRDALDGAKILMQRMRAGTLQSNLTQAYEAPVPVASILSAAPAAPVAPAAPEPPPPPPPAQRRNFIDSSVLTSPEQLTGSQPPPAAEPAQKSPPPADHEHPAVDLGLNEPPAICPRCQWSVRVPFHVELTDADKVNYRMTLFGKRFYKEFSVFGGAARIRFRTLTRAEVKLTDRQLSHDIRHAEKAGTPLSLLEAYDRWRLYRLTMSVEQIAFGFPHEAECRTEEFPTVDEIPFTPTESEPTVLARLPDAFMEVAAPSEEMMLTLTEAYERFLKVEAKLRAMRNEQSFWQGIVSDR